MPARLLWIHERGLFCVCCEFVGGSVCVHVWTCWVWLKNIRNCYFWISIVDSSCLRFQKSTLVYFFMNSVTEEIGPYFANGWLRTSSFCTFLDPRSQSFPTILFLAETRFLMYLFFSMTSLRKWDHISRTVGFVRGFCFKELYSNFTLTKRDFFFISSFVWHHWRNRPISANGFFRLAVSIHFMTWRNPELIYSKLVLCWFFLKSGAGLSFKRMRFWSIVSW